MFCLLAPLPILLINFRTKFLLKSGNPLKLEHAYVGFINIPTLLFNSRSRRFVC